jgi:hypothetical protein
MPKTYPANLQRATLASKLTGEQPETQTHCAKGQRMARVARASAPKHAQGHNERMDTRRRTALYWIGLVVGSAVALSMTVLILAGVVNAWAWFTVALIVFVVASQILVIRKEHRRHVRS